VGRVFGEKRKCELKRYKYLHMKKIVVGCVRYEDKLIIIQVLQIFEPRVSTTRERFIFKIQLEYEIRKILLLERKKNLKCISKELHLSKARNCVSANKTQDKDVY